MIVLLSPFDFERAAVHDDAALASGASCLASCHSCSAGSCATSHRDTTSALPNANSNAVRTHFSKFDVSAFRKRRVVFQSQTSARDISMFHIAHEDDIMRVAHTHEAPSWQVYSNRIELCLILEDRLTHIDRHAFHDGIFYMQIENFHSREREQANLRLVRQSFFIKILPDAATGIAAHHGF